MSKKKKKNKFQIDKIDIPRIEDFIKNLNREDLTYLNKIIVDRINLLSQMKSTENMAKFHVGQIVGFMIEGELKQGRIIRLNKKTVSIITSDDVRWKVPPVFLKSLE